LPRPSSPGLPSRLYVICDLEICARAGWALVDFAAACLEGGARFLQVRAKEASGRTLLEAATAIVGRARGAGAVVVVNDRPDIARLSGAAGVHVGQDDLSPAAVRAVVGPAAMVGLSTHTIEQIAAAVCEPISYVAVGPVFGTSTKATGHDAVGVDLVRHAAGEAVARQLPVVAIGGITVDNAPAALRAGAASVAVISDLLATGDPTARVRELLSVTAGSGP
jgi:thiamine-phosphate pyrophosphorylase